MDGYAVIRQLALVLAGTRRLIVTYLKAASEDTGPNKESDL
jgi:hypothetical protein